MTAGGRFSSKEPAPRSEVQASCDSSPASASLAASFESGTTRIVPSTSVCVTGALSIPSDGDGAIFSALTCTSRGAADKSLAAWQLVVRPWQFDPSAAGSPALDTSSEY